MDTVKSDRISPQDIQTIVRMIESVRYGSVNIIIQDGRIVQLERNEKLRLN